jgi:hypothetical protein
MENLHDSRPAPENMALGGLPIAASSMLRLFRYASIVAGLAGVWYMFDGILLTWKTGRVDCAIGIGLLLMLFSAGCGAIRQWRSEPR